MSKVEVALLWLLIFTTQVFWDFILIADAWVAARLSAPFVLGLTAFYVLLLRLNRNRAQRGPAAAVGGGAAAGAAEADSSEPSTVELPLSPALKAVVAKRAGKARRLGLIVAFVGLVVFQLFGAFLSVWAEDPVAKVIGILLMVGYSLLLAAAIGLLGWWRGRLSGRDLRETTYLRTSGPVEVERVGSAYSLKLPDRSFWVDARVAERLGGANRPLGTFWATVDYTKHGHVIFEVRDADGRSVYRAPEYDPPSVEHPAAAHA